MTGPDAPFRILAVAFLVTVSMLFVLRPLARSVGLLDRPGGHKTHSGDVPVIGGIAIYFGLFFAAMVGPELTRNAVVMLTVGALMVVVGVVDDRFNLKPSVRLVAQVAASIVLVIGTDYVVDSLGSILGFDAFDLGFLALPFTVIACVALVNACNMLDGMDGLAGGTSLVAFIAFATVAVTSNTIGAVVVCSALVGALVAFLIFNLPTHFNRPLRTFLGDAGSTLMGFTLSAVALVLVQRDKGHMAPAYVLWFVAIPIFELFTTTFRRLRIGRSPLFPDNGHFHHTLLEAGFSVRLIFVIYFGVSAACASLGLIAYFREVPEWELFVGFVILYAAWLLFVWKSPAIGAWLPVKLRRDIENLHV